MLRGSVLLTGGTGFLGRAILRRAQREQWPAHFTIFSRDVMRQTSVAAHFGDLNLRFVVGDVRNDDQVDRVVGGHDAVLHLAAFKHVPQAETAVSECISINVDGSRNVLRAAIRHRIPLVAAVSTDKATAPFNTYGVTKLLMERMFQEAARDCPHTRFVLARYGNVVGSTGSVVPVWRRQAEETGKIKITALAMTRFWMSPDDAVTAVLRATEVESGGIFIAKCPAMRLGDMANALFPDAEKQLLGPRSGEKLHEQLLSHQESAWAVEGGDSFVLVPIARAALNAGATAYGSDAPVRWLTASEFCAMVKDGESV